MSPDVVSGSYEVQESRVPKNFLGDLQSQDTPLSHNTNESLVISLPVLSHGLQLTLVEAT